MRGIKINVKRSQLAVRVFGVTASTAIKMLALALATVSHATDLETKSVKAMFDEAFENAYNLTNQ